MWKKAAVLSLAGFAAGAVISIIFILTGSPDGLTGKNVPHILLGGLYGAAAMGSTVIYDVEKWSIARATATHFLLSFALYFLLVITMGWFRLDDPVFWIVVAAMALGYILIWLFQYLSWKRKIREMNEQLKNRQPGENTD